MTPSPQHPAGVNLELLVHAEEVLRTVGDEPFESVNAVGHYRARYSIEPLHRRLIRALKGHYLDRISSPRASKKSRAKLARSLRDYRGQPTEEGQQELLEAIRVSLDSYLKSQAEAEQGQRDLARRAHRVAVASMIFGLAGWIVALVQLALGLFGVGQP